MEFCLSYSLAEDKHKLLLGFTKDCPERIGSGDNGGFARSAKGNNKDITHVLIFSEGEDFSLEESCSVFNVVSEIEVEEVEVTFSSDHCSYLPFLQHRLQEFRLDYLWIHDYLHQLIMRQVAELLGPWPLVQD